ncbi:MAG: prolyl oligopeptidase family serine peptidase [Proteobacteria bacterium]|nr:prolyl oligopeptidase family serine peptidase [Pseudomonadota bacterium]
MIHQSFTSTGEAGRPRADCSRQNLRNVSPFIVGATALALAGCVPAPTRPVAGAGAEPAAVAPASASAWTPAMQMDVRRVSNPRLSPSGRHVVFEVATADLDADRWSRQLRVASADRAGDSGPLVGCEDCRDARWGADDGLLFARATDDAGLERVFAVQVKTGDRRPVTPAAARVGWYEPSPDGAWVAYTTLEQPASGAARWQLHAVSTTNGAITSWDIDASAGEFAWAPTSDCIVVVYQPAATLDWRGKFLTLATLSDGAVTRLSTGPGAAWLPQFDTRGRRIAFVASPGAATWMRDAELRVLELDSNAVITLAATPDRNVDLLGWHPGGEALLGLEYEGSTRRLVEVPLDGGPAHYLGPSDRSVREPHAVGDRLAFVSERWNKPPEVFVGELPSLAGRIVSSVQPDLRAPLGQTEVVRWTSSDGIEVEGLLTYPVGYREGARYPLLVRLHGGPPFPASDGFIGGTFMTAYPLAAIAAAGFAILQPNFRGSAGYGRTFRHALHGDWGGQDVRDIMAGVDAMIAGGVADPERLGIMGWSYGGYLAASVLTQTDRFAAASIGAGMTDLSTFADSTSLGGMLADWLGDGRGDSAALYRERSPLARAESVSCPVLVQHGTSDSRVPIDQAQRFIAALARPGAEVEFAPYAGGHGPRAPRAVLDVLERNLRWFARQLRPVAASPRIGQAPGTGPDAPGRFPVLVRKRAPIVSLTDYEFPLQDYGEWLSFVDKSEDAAWRGAAMRQLVDEQTFHRYRDRATVAAHRLAYRSDGLTINGFIVAPKRCDPRCPVVLFAHGGVAQWGRITFFDVLEMHRLAERGYIVLASALRGEGGSEGSPNLGAGDRDDMIRLLNVAAHIDGADTTRVGLWGFSRGGALGYRVLAATDAIDAAVLVGARSDFVNSERRAEFHEHVYPGVVDDYEADEDAALRALSATYWPEKLAAGTSVLLLHGANDSRVPVGDSLQMATHLARLERPFRLVVPARGSHTLIEHQLQVRKHLDDWFDQHLKGAGRHARQP